MLQNKMPIILGAKRTAIGNFNGCFSHTKAPTLGAAAIASCIQQAGCQPQWIDQVIMGCVLAAGLGQAPARQAALHAGLSVNTPCVTVNKMCGSGMASIIFGVDAIAATSSDVVVAGGFENMSQAPYLLAKARQGYRLGNDTLYDHMLCDGLEDAYSNGEHMGYFAERCAQKLQFSRQQQDAFALTSIERARHAIENHFFDEEICPVVTEHKGKESVIACDEGPMSVSIDKIPTLTPAFIKDGTITAANASSISDGGAAILLASHTFAKEHALKGIAQVIAHDTYAGVPDQFPTAPIEAIRNVLSKAQWSIEEVDLFEINEAFAAVTMAAMQALSIPHSKVNIHGGACILGHPVGASGTRIVVTLIHALKRLGLKKGVAALCIAGGEATALAIELID